jgi:hypothetical protein
MKQLIETHLKSRNYTEKEVCRILNSKQAKLYIKNGVYPIDIYVSLDDKDNDVIVYIFLKEETRHLYQAWLNYELE